MEILRQMNDSMLWEDDDHNFFITFRTREGEEKSSGVGVLTEFGFVNLSRDFVKSLTGSVYHNEEGNPAGINKPGFYPWFPEELPGDATYTFREVLWEELKEELNVALETTQDFWIKTELFFIQRDFVKYRQMNNNVDESYEMCIARFMKHSLRTLVYATYAEVLETLISKPQMGKYEILRKKFQYNGSCISFTCVRDPLDLGYGSYDLLVENSYGVYRESITTLYKNPGVIPVYLLKYAQEIAESPAIFCHEEEEEPYDEKEYWDLADWQKLWWQEELDEIQDSFDEKENRERVKKFKERKYRKTRRKPGF